MPTRRRAAFGVEADVPWPLGDFVVKLLRSTGPALRLTGSLITAAEAAAALAKPSLGGPRDEDRHTLTRGLADIYEGLTGKPVTWGSHPVNGEPSTGFGRFCQAALGGLFSPKITRTVCLERRKGKRTDG